MRYCHHQALHSNRCGLILPVKAHPGNAAVPVPCLQVQMSHQIKNETRLYQYFRYKRIFQQGYSVLHHFCSTPVCNSFLPRLYPDFALCFSVPKRVTPAIGLHVLDSRCHRFSGNSCISSYGGSDPATGKEWKFAMLLSFF